jgi:hypothetical protein
MVAMQVIWPIRIVAWRKKIEIAHCAFVATRLAQSIRSAAIPLHDLAGWQAMVVHGSVK